MFVASRKSCKRVAFTYYMYVLYYKVKKSLFVCVFFKVVKLLPGNQHNQINDSL